jgi:hypothetical protein
MPERRFPKIIDHVFAKHTVIAQNRNLILLPEFPTIIFDDENL